MKFKEQFFDDDFYVMDDYFQSSYQIFTDSILDFKSIIDGYNAELVRRKIMIYEKLIDVKVCG